MASVAEKYAMRRAIVLSAAGIATTSPNPPVGCVVLDREGRVAGEGFHLRKGEAHAEAKALAQAGDKAAGGTAVVSLEPCNHVGRTPACRQALIDAEIARVVIAVLDPTSRGEGGAAMLSAAGVDVEVGVLEGEAKVVVGPWLTALEILRPIITWPYVVAAKQVKAVNGDVDDVRCLTLNSDAVFYGDGRVREATLGSHGAGILHIADFPTSADRRDMVRSLYDGGVRRLLLACDQAVATSFIELDLVDRVCAYLPDAGTQERLDLVALVPPGFRITTATRVEKFVRVDAERNGILQGE